MNAPRQLGLAIVGYGKMGRAIELAAMLRGHRVRVRVDPKAPGADAREIEPGLLHGCDIALEFSHGAIAPRNVHELLEAGIPTISGTTGWATPLDDAREAATRRGTGFMWAPNFSLGVAVTVRLAELAARWLGEIGGYAPYLVEAHHQEKRDAPSGTARRLAELLVAATPGKTRYGVAPDDGPVPADLVPVAWIRAGSIPGTHTVGWDGPGETIELVHGARDRAVFAHGALRAAEWLVGRTGPHTIDEMLDDVLSHHAGR